MADKNDTHEMIVAIYVIFLKHKTCKQATDCADYDNAGEGGGSPRASEGSDRREET